MVYVLMLSLDASVYLCDFMYGLLLKCLLMLYGYVNVVYELLV